MRGADFRAPCTRGATDLGLDDQLMANTWQGHFPTRTRAPEVGPGRRRWGSFPANGYGLFDVTGNVWECTVEPWSASHKPLTAPCCGPSSPVSSEGARRVLKGRSHLCSPEHCLRYRPAARSPESEDTSTTLIGFPLLPAPTVSLNTVASPARVIPSLRRT